MHDGHKCLHVSLEGEEEDRVAGGTDILSMREHGLWNSIRYLPTLQHAVQLESCIPR